MAKKKFGTNRQQVRFSGNQFDSSDLGHRYMMMGQQVPSGSISGIPPPAPIQFHRDYYNINISNPNQFLVPTPHMWSPAPNSNFLPTPQRSTLNPFSLTTPHMWLPTLNPIFSAHQGVHSPFVGPTPQPAHPPHQNRFSFQPVLVPCHPYLMHLHPPYVGARPVSSRQHALHNGGIVPRIPSHQSPRNCSFIPCLDGPVRIRGQMFNSAPPFRVSDPPIVQTPREGYQYVRRRKDPEVPSTSARQADDSDNLALPFHAKHPQTVQTPKEGCQCDPSSMPREKDYEVTATWALQANNTDSTQNYSSPPAKAAVADKHPVASITAGDKTADEISQEPGLVASETASRFVLHWPSGTKIEIAKSPDSAYLCELPTDESVFYEWWEVAPDSSRPQSVLVSLGLEGRECWDGLNLMLEGLSKSSEDTPSSPQSILASEHLGADFLTDESCMSSLFDEGADYLFDESCMSSLFDEGADSLFDESCTSSLFDEGADSLFDESCTSSLFDVGAADLTEELTEELTAKKKYSMEFMLSLAEKRSKLPE